MHVSVQPGSFDERPRFRITKLQRILHIRRQHGPVLHEDLAVDDDRVDIATQNLMDEPMNWHPVRSEMRFVHVNDCNIRLLSDLQRSNLMIHANSPSGIDRDHLEHFAGRKKVPVMIVQKVLSELGEAGSCTCRNAGWAKHRRM